MLAVAFGVDDEGPSLLSQGSKGIPSSSMLSSDGDTSGHAATAIRRAGIHDQPYCVV